MFRIPKPLARVANSHYFRKLDPDPHKSKKLNPEKHQSKKFGNFRGSKQISGEPWKLTVEAWRLKMDPWRVYRLVVTNSHHFDEEQDPDPNMHLSEKLDTDPD